ncbi:MAG: 16S rRNA (cytosine(1402)-N(4))-methyltransferase RsmH [Alphaproteobacteria bacterium]
MNDSVPATTVHVPVLLEGVMQQLGELKDKKLIDGTLGGGGYTTAFLHGGASVMAFDQDAVAIERAQKTILPQHKKSLILVHNSFAHMAEEAVAHGWEKVDGIALDLGISSDQLDTPDRGFTYQQNGVLDMRLGQTGRTAADVLNRSDERELADIFYYFGDEPKSRPLARAIVQTRKTQPFQTTSDLLKVIEQIYPPRVWLKRKHPAQRLFQAVRMAVNNEVDALAAVIPQAASLLAEGGKLCIVTFHSIEDRMVKQAYRELCQPVLDGVGRQIAEGDYFMPVRKVVPTDAEVAANPRARSGTLRVLQRRVTS